MTRHIPSDPNWNPASVGEAPCPDLLAAARALHRDAVGAELAAWGAGQGEASSATDVAPITCMVMTGDLFRFGREPGAVPVLVERPAPENGWRSQTDVRNGGGQRISVELISNVGGIAPSTAGRAAHRARALRSIGDADRSLVRRELDCPADHQLGTIPLDEGGVVDLVQLSELLDAFEARRLPANGRPSTRRVRRMHGFPGVPSPAPCELVLRIWSGIEPNFFTISIRSHLRRAGSKEIMAVCETLYRK